MIIPVRCFSCNNEIGNKYELYILLSREVQTFEDGVQHVSVHLQAYRQELFTAKTEKELKKDALNLYEKFEPTLFKEKLNQFLNTNL